MARLRRPQQPQPTSSLGENREDSIKPPQKNEKWLTLSMLLVSALGFFVISLTAAAPHHLSHPLQKHAPNNNNLIIPNEAAKPSASQILQEGFANKATIHKFSDTLDTCQSTIVTAYYKVPSKYEAPRYMKWMVNFLSINDCLVIFTSADMVETMRQFRSQHAAAKTVIVQLALDDLPLARMGGFDFWQHQLDIDPERMIHKSFQLFWIWLSKSWFVVQAIRANFFRSTVIFLWQDIGAFRDDKYRGKRIIAHPEIVPPRTILWMAHHPPNPPPDPIWNDKLDKKNGRKYYFHSGSQGAGSAPAWLEFHAQFAITMDIFLDRNMFIGEDQCLLQSTCQLNPSLCAYVRFTDVRDNNYFGLRYALLNGGQFNLWRMPPIQSSN